MNDQELGYKNGVDPMSFLVIGDTEEEVESFVCKVGMKFFGGGYEENKKWMEPCYFEPGDFGTKKEALVYLKQKRLYGM